MIDLASVFSLSANTIVYAFGLFELLIGISLLANMYVGLFASLAVVFLAIIPFFHGFSEVLVRDIGLIGGLISLIFWPKQRYR